MGNYTSCCYVHPKTAKLIDFQGNLRHVKVPITAAELMLEEPGHAISPADDFQRTHRFSALKADEELLGGKVYLLIPTNRIHSKVSESEMALLDSASEKRRMKRRSSKVLPAVNEEEVVEKIEEDPIRVSAGGDTGFPSYRLRQWKPVLEPICEGI